MGRYVGPQGLDIRSLAIFCFVWGMAGSMISLQISRWSAKRMTGMQLVNGRTGDATADWLYGAVEQLTRKANLPMPEVGIYDSPEVNAFATGPSKSRSLVAVSSGLLRSMRREEVEGVLAHEVAHIANGDMVTMTLLQGIVNAFVMFLARIIAYALTSRGSRDDQGAAPSFMLVMMLELVLGALGMIVVAWFSRQREFRADHGGASLAGKSSMLNGAAPPRRQPRGHRPAARSARDDEDQRQVDRALLHAPAARTADCRARARADRLSAGRNIPGSHEDGCDG